MRNTKEVFYRGSANKIVRRILVENETPTAQASTITKTTLIIKKGSSRYEFNSTDNSEVVSNPSADWEVEISLASLDIAVNRYRAYLLLLDPTLGGEIFVKPFVLVVKNV